MTKKFKHPQNPIKRNISVFKVSFAGWLYAMRTDPGTLQWFVICVVLTPVAFWLGENSVERALMLLALWFIYIVELINTALEATLDRISEEYDEAIKAAKDIGSASVFITALIALVVWALIIFSN